IVAAAGAAPDVVDTGLPCEIAAARGGAAPGRRTPDCRIDGSMGRSAAAAMAHHRADAVEEQRAPDNAGGSRCGRAQERAAPGSRLRAQCGCRLGFGAVFGRYAHGGAWRPHRRDRARALRVAAPPYAVAHRVEEAALLRRLGTAELIFEFADAGFGSLERFVLDQHSLHQAIGRIGGLPQAVLDQAFGVAIALRVFERRQAIEQVGDEIAFLWSHRLSPVFPVTRTHVGSGKSRLNDRCKNICRRCWPRPAWARATRGRASRPGKESPMKKAYSCSRRVVSGSRRCNSASTKPGWHITTLSSGRHSRKRGNMAAKSARP